MDMNEIISCAMGEYILVDAGRQRGGTFFVLCVLRISETSSSLPWKSETLADCFGDNIGNRVSAKMLAQ